MPAIAWTNDPAEPAQPTLRRKGNQMSLSKPAHRCLLYQPKRIIWKLRIPRALRSISAHHMRTRVNIESWHTSLRDSATGAPQQPRTLASAWYRCREFRRIRDAERMLIGFYLAAANGTPIPMSLPDMADLEHSPVMLPEPTLTLTLPSLHDGLALDCRVYHPQSLTASLKAPSWQKHAAIVAHPYAPLGGCYDDPVVEIVAGTLLRLGFLVSTFNFRFDPCAAYKR